MRRKMEKLNKKTDQKFLFPFLHATRRNRHLNLGFGFNASLLSKLLKFPQHPVLQNANT